MAGVKQQNSFPGLDCFIVASLRVVRHALQRGQTLAAEIFAPEDILRMVQQ